MLFAVETPAGLSYNLVGKARCYTSAQLATLAARIATDLELAVTASAGRVD